MLYANEIAIRYGLVENDKPKSAKVTSILKRYAKKNNIVIHPLYYHTQYGLKRVYPEALYKPAMEEYVKLGG
jgi:hypothetical protein